MKNREKMETFTKQRFLAIFIMFYNDNLKRNNRKDLTISQNIYIRMPISDLASVFSKCLNLKC